MFEEKGRGGQRGTQPLSMTPQIPMPRPPQAFIPGSKADSLPQIEVGCKWNTKNLGLRIGADATSAAAASVLVAPVICIIDRSIVTKAATNQPISRLLLASLLPALTAPHKFLISRPFLLICSLYFSTYFTANTIDTLTSTLRFQPASKVTSNTTKFLATSAVNMSMCVYKDSQFARLFGKKTASPAGMIPRLSYALFALRDSMTIFASFNLPSTIAPHLTSLPPAIKQRFSRILSTESARMNTAQFLAPAAMQLCSTPIHLLGLDLFNRQRNLGWRERWGRVRRDWGVSALARIGRIIPAFGVGGVVNARVRRGLMEDLE